MVLSLQSGSCQLNCFLSMKSDEELPKTMFSLPGLIQSNSGRLLPNRVLPDLGESSTGQ